MSARISTLTAIHFVVAREQLDVTFACYYVIKFLCSCVQKVYFSLLCHVIYSLDSNSCSLRRGWFYNTVETLYSGQP